ncbi:hypothetical protein QG37_04326 [Candidozyma auris]|nr:hypothetical protein QG37_04326 [[Candida] auris]
MKNFFFDFLDEDEIRGKPLWERTMPFLIFARKEKKKKNYCVSQQKINP